MPRRTMYQVLTANKKTTKGTRSKTTLHATLGTQNDAMDVAQGYVQTHPNRRAGVFRATRLKVFTGRGRKRGRIIK